MIAHEMERARGGHWLSQEMQARRANLRRARAGLHQQIERLTEAYLAGVVPLNEYQRRRQDAEGRLVALDGQERELTHDADRQAEAARLAAHAEAFCQRVRQGRPSRTWGGAVGPPTSNGEKLTRRETGLPATTTFFRFCSPPRFWTVSVASCWPVRAITERPSARCLARCRSRCGGCWSAPAMVRASRR